MAITNNIALEKLEVGSIAADGGVSTTFAALGRTGIARIIVTAKKLNPTKAGKPAFFYMILPDLM